jgi:hypothetical protein
LHNVVGIVQPPRFVNTSAIDCTDRRCHNRDNPNLGLPAGVYRPLTGLVLIRVECGRPKLWPHFLGRTIVNLDPDLMICGLVFQSVSNPKPVVVAAHRLTIREKSSRSGMRDLDGVQGDRC